MLSLRDSRKRLLYELLDDENLYLNIFTMQSVVHFIV